MAALPLKKVIVAAGARPNFMKIAVLVNELKKNKSIQTLLVHTGQHYDYQMSEIFFRELRIPKPDVFLEVGSGLHGEQTGKILSSFEKILLQEKPDLVIVAGDVNSTLACALAAVKVRAKVAHIESGLRSFDRTMPEEINRLATDAISDILFVSEPSGLVNLRREGASKEKVHYVGNVMMDALTSHLGQIDQSPILSKMTLAPKKYAVLTLHRPSNVDSARALEEIFEILEALGQKMDMVYPIHPRTKAKMVDAGLLDKFLSLKSLKMTEPLGYMDFMKLVKESCLVLTDSGGIQEETTYLGIPCLTMRDNTERPATIKEGTNVLVGRQKENIMLAAEQVAQGRWKQGRVPKYWDGRATWRMLKVIQKLLLFE